MDATTSLSAYDKQMIILADIQAAQATFAQYGTEDSGAPAAILAKLINDLKEMGLADLINGSIGSSDFIKDVQAQYITGPGGRDLAEYAMQICCTAMDMEQDICNSLLTSVQQDTVRKQELSKALTSVQQTRPSDIKGIGSIPADTAALLAQFGLTISAGRQADFDGVITGLQNYESQTDSVQQQNMILYNQHNSQVSTLAELLSKIIELIGNTEQETASDIR